MAFSITRQRLQQNVISGSVKSFLQQEQSTLRQAPIIIVSNCKSNNNNNDILTKQVEFYGQQAMGYQMIPFSLDKAAYPLRQEDADPLLSLQQRTGATAIIGVGSGVAMDTVKRASSLFEHTYLLPETDAAVLASYTHFPMLLDTHEETIVTTTQHQPQTNNTTTTIVLDSGHIRSHNHTKSACHSILLNSESSSAKQVLESLLQQKQPNLHWLQQTAPYLQDGTGSETRSIPLALSCSLIPPVFASTHVFTFWAALLLGEHADQQHDDEKVPSLASLALEALTVQKLMQYIRSNQAAQPSVIDATDDELEMVLSTSLNR